MNSVYDLGDTERQALEDALDDEYRAMARIEAARDSRDAYWEAHPDELTQQQRMDFFRRGVGDARKAGVLVK